MADLIDYYQLVCSMTSYQPTKSKSHILHTISAISRACISHIGVAQPDPATVSGLSV